jgi:hypothetical protein
MTLKLYAFTCGTVTGEFAHLMEAPTMPGGGSPRPGVMGPYRPRVPGRENGRISQRLRENRAAHYFRSAILQRVRPESQGLCRLRAPRNPRETPPKGARKGPEKGWRLPAGYRVPAGTHPKVPAPAFPGESLTPPAFRPCVVRRNRWFQTRHGSSALPNNRRRSSGRCSNNDHRSGFALRQVRKRRARSRL